MEVHLSAGVQAKLEQVTEQTRVREMLHRRHDEMESGKVELIDGEEAYRLLMARTQKSRLRGTVVPVNGREFFESLRLREERLLNKSEY